MVEMKNSVVVYCFFFVLVAGLLISGCQNGQKLAGMKDGDIQVVSIKNSTKKTFESPFFFRQAEIVPLETSVNCYLKNIRQVEAIDFLLFVKDTEGLYLFNRQGRFITQIGKKGQGPGEYVLVSSFFLDKEKRIVHIVDDYQGRILSYDFEGNYLKTMPVAIDDVQYCEQTMLTAERNLLINYSFNPEFNMGYGLLELSKDSSVCRKQFSYAPISLKDYLYSFSRHSMEKTGDEIHFIMPVCDTIYAYSNQSFYPKYVVETPCEMADKQALSGSTPSNSYFFMLYEQLRKGAFGGFTGLFETEELLLLNYQHEKGSGFYLANKETMEGNYYTYTYMFGKQVPVFPIVGRSENQFIGTIECEELLSFKEQMDVNNPEYAKLREIIEGNRIDDNPILVFYNN